MRSREQVLGGGSTEEISGEGFEDSVTERRSRHKPAITVLKPVEKCYAIFENEKFLKTILTPFETQMTHEQRSNSKTKRTLECKILNVSHYLF